MHLQNIRGEIYEVDDETLSELDKLEEHPHLYTREVRDFTISQTGEIVQAWIYLFKKYKPEMLQLKYWESYESEGDHGLKYVARYALQVGRNNRIEIFSD